MKEVKELFLKVHGPRSVGSREKEIKNDLQRSLSEDLTKTNLSEKINKPLDN